jgi:hypothetical protein
MGGKIIIKRQCVRANVSLVLLPSSRLRFRHIMYVRNPRQSTWNVIEPGCKFPSATLVYFIRL